MKLLIFLALIGVVFSILVFLPTINIDVDAVTSSSAFEYVRAALYFFPMHTVTAILALICSIWLFRVIIALVKTLWDLLPVA